MWLEETKLIHINFEDDITYEKDVKKLISALIDLYDDAKYSIRIDIILDLSNEVSAVEIHMDKNYVVEFAFDNDEFKFIKINGDFYPEWDVSFEKSLEMLRKTHNAYQEFLRNINFKHENNLCVDI